MAWIQLVDELVDSDAPDWDKLDASKLELTVDAVESVRERLQWHQNQVLGQLEQYLKSHFDSAQWSEFLGRISERAQTSHRIQSEIVSTERRLNENKTGLKAQVENWVQQWPEIKAEHEQQLKLRVFESRFNADVLQYLRSMEDSLSKDRVLDAVNQYRYAQDSISALKAEFPEMASQFEDAESKIAEVALLVRAKMEDLFYEGVQMGLHEVDGFYVEFQKRVRDVDFADLLELMHAVDALDSTCASFAKKITKYVLEPYLNSQSVEIRIDGDRLVGRTSSEIESLEMSVSACSQLLNFIFAHFGDYATNFARHVASDSLSELVTAYFRTRLMADVPSDLVDVEHVRQLMNSALSQLKSSLRMHNLDSLIRDSLWTFSSNLEIEMARKRRQVLLVKARSLLLKGDSGNTLIVDDPAPDLKQLASAKHLLAQVDKHPLHKAQSGNLTST